MSVFDRGDGGGARRRGDGHGGEAQSGTVAPRSDTVSPTAVSTGASFSPSVYLTQLWCLCVKNALVLWRCKKVLAAFLLAPAALVALAWLIQSRIDSGAKADSRGVDVELQYQSCNAMDIYGHADPSMPCVSLYYSPAGDAQVESVMRGVSSRLSLQWGVDVVGVSDVQKLMWTLAANVGRYDAAVSFDTLPPWCTTPPCDTMSAEEVAEAQAAHALRTASGATKEPRRVVGDMSSCPISTPLNVEYSLWYNATENANDRVPGFVSQPQQRIDQDNNQAVPPRYWAIQQAINLAVTEAISAPGVPDDGRKGDAGTTAEQGEEDEQRDAHVDDSSAFVGADPSSSNLHISLFSMYAGRTGFSSDWMNGNSGGSIFNLDNYQNDSVTKFAGSSILTIGVLVITLLAMQLVAAEKQGRIIGILRIMGLKESVYWTSWIGVFALLATVASLLAAGMGKISDLHIYEFCDFSIHFFALLLYITAMCSLGLLFASFVQRPLLLNILGFLLFFMSMICNVFFGNVFANIIYRPDMPNILTILFWIFPWFHFSKVWADMLQNTSNIVLKDASESGRSVHVQLHYRWSQITREQRVYLDCAFGDEQCCQKTNTGTINCFDAPSTSSALVNLFLLTLIYSVLAWYLAQVFGASLGMNRRAWFPLTAEFWGLQTEDDRKLAALQAMNQGEGSVQGGGGGMAQRFLSQDRLVNEQYLSLRNHELRTYKLSKAYAKTSALKEATLKMHAGEVFCLLGHNGAGKSTLVNCLTGLLAPTHGQAFIFGHSLSNVHRIQSEMGVCMQDDLLISEMTTRETLRLFASIRGIEYGQLSRVVEGKLAQFHMQSYADKQVMNLSGGMKRRLSLSLATLGDPKIIFLDEPTTGMDPVNRNKIWEVIRELKVGRIVVLTTHDMLEADYLGDTIAIMSNGRSLYLKNHYGAGYHLSLLVNPAFHSQISGIIKRLLPGCEIIHSAGGAPQTADTIGQQQDKGKEGGAAGAGDAQSQTQSSGHGNITIGLKRKSLRALPAFFRWLEQEEQRYKATEAERLAAGGSAAAAVDDQASSQVLREWSLSNSTLEEVFLRLCQSEKGINERLGHSAADDDAAEAEALAREDEARFGAELEESANPRCMLCRTRPSLDLVTLYSKAGLAVDFANLLCAVCSHTKEAQQMLGGGARADAQGQGLLSPSAVQSPNEDDAPILLSTADAAHVDVASLQVHALAQPSVPNGQGESTPLLAAAAAAPVAPRAPKGVNNELDIANSESEFHAAWDSLGHAPPSSAAQIRAVFLKNVALAGKEQKSNACKLIILALLAFAIMYQSTGNSKMCPGGWTPMRDKYDDNTLPCELYNVTQVFGRSYLNPTVPMQSAYGQKAKALDSWECALSPDQNQCGFVPAWPINSWMSSFVAMTSDVLEADASAPNGLRRSTTDAPFRSWSIAYPRTFIYNQWTRYMFNLQDQTDNIINNRARTLPPQPTGLIPAIPKPLVPPSPWDTPRISSETGQRDLARDGPPIRTLDDILWQSQLFVDSNATALAPRCSTWDGFRSAVLLHFDSDTWNSEMALVNYMSQVWPSVGLELMRSRPYPVRDGKRVNETSRSAFRPELQLRVRYYDNNKLPQSFTSWSNDISYCRNQSPIGLSSSDMMSLLHALTNSFLLTRMQSLWTDRLDLNRSVTFTPYFDGFVAQPGQSVCPNPSVRASFVQMPPVLFDPLLSKTSIYMCLGLLMFLSLLNLPNGVAHLLHEREAKLLHMMRISGMRDLSYWTAVWLWDLFIGSLWFAALLIFGYAYGSPIFTRTSGPLFAFVLLVFTHYSIGLSWVMAALFSSKRIGLVVCYLLVVLASFLAMLLDMYLPTTWPMVYLFVPPLAHARALSSIIRYTPTTLSDAHGAQLLSAVLIMLFQGCAMLLIGCYANVCMYRGVGFLLPHWCRRKMAGDDGDAASVNGVEMSFQQSSRAGLLSPDEQADALVEDVDCAAERAKVEALVAQAGHDHYPAVLLHNLRKEFPSTGAATTASDGTPLKPTTKVAVNRLSMAVEYGECYGLLGPNGAGKSTTLSMLTGLLDATSGSAFLCGFDIARNRDSVFSILGICPQFDTVWEDLTVFDHLMFYARLKGISRSWERGLVHYIAELTELDGDPLLKSASSLSGGMKRRLSLGISLIGNPRVWLLDEPSTGLSPETRREIWSIIEKRKRRGRAGPAVAASPGGQAQSSSLGKAIIITTHAMEEADTLCDRIAILADGGLQCVGSASHLKRRYGEGFKLTLHLAHEFEQAGVDEVLRAEAAAGAAAAQPRDSGSEERKDASPYETVLFVDPAHRARVAQHVALVRFVQRMAPHAQISHAQGKVLQFRIHPDGKATAALAGPASTSSGAGAGAVDASIVDASSSASATGSASQTHEILGIFNQMELHRPRLLPSYGVEEWGLSQSSLEDVFMHIVDKFEKDDDTQAAGYKKDK